MPEPPAARRRHRPKPAEVQARRAKVLEAARAFQAREGRAPFPSDLFAQLGGDRHGDRVTVRNDMDHLRRRGLLGPIALAYQAPRPAPRLQFQGKPTPYMKRAMRSLRWTEEDEQIYQTTRALWGPWLHWLTAGKV